GVRPNKLWHWAAIALTAATVIHNPGGSAEFAITTLDKTGSAIGWALTRGGFDGESDYFTEPETQPTPEPSDGAGDDSAADGIELEGTADRVVVEIIQLHELVEATLTPADGEVAS
ncbi:MAG: hypothetical protein GY925_13075, partial [Actinomycetia bacterium]|nr:hypothetical protein [Actinomycetes bacterium]